MAQVHKKLDIAPHNDVNWEDEDKRDIDGTKDDDVFAYEVCSSSSLSSSEIGGAATSLWGVQPVKEHLQQVSLPLAIATTSAGNPYSQLQPFSGSNFPCCPSIYGMYSH